MSPLGESGLITIHLIGHYLARNEAGGRSYHLLKVSTCLLIKAFGLEFGHVLALLLLCLDLLLLCRQFSVDLYVKLEKMVDGIALQLFLIPVLLERQSQKAVLFAPITEICPPSVVVRSMLWPKPYS